MRRILSLVTAAVVVALMLVAMAGPALAAGGGSGCDNANELGANHACAPHGNPGFGGPSTVCNSENVPDEAKVKAGCPAF
jgi:hypothetical protein